MKKIVISLLISLTVVSACKKEEPVQLHFLNLFGEEEITTDSFEYAYKGVARYNEPFEFNYENCINGITKKRGVVYECDFKEKVSVSELTMQFIRAFNGEVLWTRRVNIDPDATSMMWYVNLPKKEKYIFNCLRNDKIVARGEIEYK